MLERSRLDEIEDLHFGVSMLIHKGKTEEELTDLLIKRGANQMQIDLVFNFIYENYQGIRLLECSKQKRALNFIIDIVSISSILFLLFISLFNKNPSSIYFITVIVTPFIYYFVLESLFARTIGKFISGTIIVDQNGKTPGIFKIFLRTISRYWLHDIYGAFAEDRIFHDKISSTYIVNKQRWTKQYEIV